MSQVHEPDQLAPLSQSRLVSPPLLSSLKIIQPTTLCFPLHFKLKAKSMKLKLLLLLLPLLRFFYLVHSTAVHRFFLRVDGGDLIELKNGTEFHLPPIEIHPGDGDKNYLLEKALKNYDGRYPPRFGHGPPVVVRVKAKVLSVPIFLEEELKLFLEMELAQEWEDERLILNTSKVIDLSAVQAVQLWQPNPVFEGPGSQILSGFRYFETHRLHPNNGTIRHLSRLTLTTPCPLSRHDFPFDQRHCNISIGSPAYSANAVVFKWSNETFSPELLEEAQEFRTSWRFPAFQLIEQTKVIQKGMTATTFSRLKIQLLAVRDVMHLVKYFVLPLGILVIWAWVPVYFMQNNPAGRITFGAVILFMAADLVLKGPRVSRDAEDFDPCLHYYCFVCLTVIAGCLLHSVVTVWWRRGEDGGGENEVDGHLE